MPQRSRSELFNPIGAWIDEGLVSWKSAGAKIQELPSQTLSVPKIVAESLADHNLGTVIYATSFHAEEQSGPKFACEPLNFDLCRKLGFSIIIYFVNQYGLHFGAREINPRWYRESPEGVNYNDSWGKKQKDKPTEIRAIETDICKESQARKIVCSVAAHDDSDTPRQGYLFTLNFRRQKRDKVANLISHSSSSKYLVEFSPDDDVGYGGEIEKGWIVVNPKDGYSYEDWICQKLKIPSIVIEGPFGAPLDEAVLFQSTMFNAIINSL